MRDATREQFPVQEYPPDFYRQIAEPMELAYLARNFSCVKDTWWAEGDLQNGKWLDQTRGIDGVIAVQTSSDTRPRFLALQITVADLRNPEARERMFQKLRAWRQNPVYAMNGEAKELGGREGEPMPVVFFHMPSVEVDDAWQKTPKRPDWRTKDARKAAENAAAFLPVDRNYRHRMLQGIISCFDQMLAERPDLTNIITPYQEAFLQEQKILREK